MQACAFALALVASTAGTAALAQAPLQSKPPLVADGQQTGDPKACAQPHDTVGKGGGGRTANGQDLSNKLAQSNGVICPPAHIDPKMDKPVPPAGTMPVIPPPGTPGGDRNVVPK